MDCYREVQLLYSMSFHNYLERGSELIEAGCNRNRNILSTMNVIIRPILPSSLSEISNYEVNLAVLASYELLHFSQAHRTPHRQAHLS